MKKILYVWIAVAVLLVGGLTFVGFNIKKQDNGVLKRYNYLDIKYANVDNVIGLSINDAIKRLKDFKVEIEGEGDKVIYQSPINTSISVGETVRIMLGK